MKISIVLWFLPLVSYVKAWNILDAVLNCEHDKSLSLDVSEIRVSFYDFSNNIVRDFPINEATEGILSLPKLDKTKKFFIFVGGFQSSKNTEDRVREAFKDYPFSYLIIINHSTYSNIWPDFKTGYERAVEHVFHIGRRLAQMLVIMHQQGFSAKNMHCIGNSLGAQILGFTGDEFFKATGQKIWRITALDPAGPCFSERLKEEQVRSGVAEYVEVYHCNAGGFGSSSILGDVEFFVNKGSSQPVCVASWVPNFLVSPKAALCSHRQCVRVWLASIAHPDWYESYKCDSYWLFNADKCNKNDKTKAGFWNTGNASGVYYFSTEGYKYDTFNGL